MSCRLSWELYAHGINLFKALETETKQIVLRRNVTSDWDPQNRQFNKRKLHHDENENILCTDPYNLPFFEGLVPFHCYTFHEVIYSERSHRGRDVKGSALTETLKAIAGSRAKSQKTFSLPLPSGCHRQISFFMLIKPAGDFQDKKKRVNVRQKYCVIYFVIPPCLLIYDFLPRI